jgi:hypothetical protein
MKKRSGWVSNSSTSSVIIMGWVWSTYEDFCNEVLIPYNKKYQIMSNEELTEYGFKEDYSYEDEYDIEWYDFYSMFVNKMYDIYNKAHSETTLATEDLDEDNIGFALAVGRSVKDIKDDETMREFRERIKKEFKEFYDTDAPSAEPSWHEYAWYDG